MQNSARHESNEEPATQGQSRRYPHIVRYVKNEDVERYKLLGYEWTSALVDTHHGEHATLMIWPHDTEPPDA